MKDELIENIIRAFRYIKKENPLVHVIPNNVSSKLCADGLAAIGARPVMAFAPEETADITAHAKSCVYNLGQPSKEKIDGIRNGIMSAIENNIPILFDPVGIGASEYRKNQGMPLLNMNWKGIIKGNIDEIKSIVTGELNHNGVDSKEKKLDKETLINIKKWIKYDKVIAITGRTDYIVSEEQIIILNRKKDKIQSLVGTGCLAGSICGAFLSVTDKLTAAVAGLGIMSLCTMKADEDAEGYGSFQVELLNNLGNVSENGLLSYLQEVITIEG